MLREWVAVASHRMDRPQLPRDTCPFCPGSPNVPEDYDVLIYPNDFPAFELPPREVGIEGDGFYRVQPARGVCDVVLYHPDHNLQPSELPAAHWLKVVRLWKKRFTELAANPSLPYVFIFENKGEVIGVTMPHPHGQMYAFPLIPPKIQQEVSAAWDHWQHHSEQCLFCRILERELADGVRILGQNEHFVAFVPFFARFPFEVHIYPRRHLQTIAEFSEEEEKGLAQILKWLLLKYDALYGFPFPYMMIQHAAPVSTADCSFFHWHIEYLPPYRSREKLKFLAGVESGSGTFLMDAAAEQKAAELRAAGPADPSEIKI
jgi:UDPglucose--hexose-1-phosphate uridylyltransferase